MRTGDKEVGSPVKRITCYRVYGSPDPALPQSFFFLTSLFPLSLPPSLSPLPSVNPYPYTIPNTH